MGCQSQSVTGGNFVRLEYFDLHGRALYIRMILWYAGVSHEDKRLSFEEFGAKKAAGEYIFGSLPVLTLPSGIQLNQSNSIARYIARVYRGQCNEVLYPGKLFPEMSYELDNLLEESAEFLNKCNKIGPFDPNAEKNIPAFLNEDFDQYCASIENHLVS